MGKNKNIIKRTIGEFGGGLLSIPFIVGLCIPGVDVLELGIMAPLFGRVIVEGGNIFLIIKKGMKTSLQKILDKEMKSMEEFEE